MNTSTCNLPAQSSNSCAALTAPRRSITPLPEVHLRTHCLVEFTVQPEPGLPRNGSTVGNGSHAAERGGVLLSIYVLHCSLHPTQVRIVEV